MPFCPSCRYEYRPEITKCPDCDEFLVAKLPPKSDSRADEAAEFHLEPGAMDEIPPDQKEWVQLARLTSSSYAAMLVEALKAKDIPVVVQSGAGHFGESGQLGTSSFRPLDGAISIYVPDDFVVAADIEGNIILGEEWEKARLVDFE